MSHKVALILFFASQLSVGKEESIPHQERNLSMTEWTPIHSTQAEVLVTKLSLLGGNDVDLENESSVEEFQAGEYDGGVNEQDLAAALGADKWGLRDANLRGDELLPSPCGISDFPNPITQRQAISLSLLALSPRMSCAGQGSS